MRVSTCVVFDAWFILYVFHSVTSYSSHLLSFSSLLSCSFFLYSSCRIFFHSSLPPVRPFVFFLPCHPPLVLISLPRRARGRPFLRKTCDPWICQSKPAATEALFRFIPLCSVPWSADEQVFEALPQRLTDFRTQPDAFVGSPFLTFFLSSCPCFPSAFPS